MAKSPSPGMDPFLEGYLWPDVHQALDSIYADAQYGLTIDYTAVPPPPKLSKKDESWAVRRVVAWTE